MRCLHLQHQTLHTHHTPDTHTHTHTHARAIDQEVVVVTLGSRPGQPQVCSSAQRLINDAVQASPSVRRLVVVTSMGVGDSYADLGWLTRFFVNTIIKRPIEDKNLQEQYVRQAFAARHDGDEQSKPSEQQQPPPPPPTKDWTIVRPGGLLNAAKTERVLARESGVRGGRIARADVAWFLLQQCLTGDQWARKAVVLVSQ